MKHLVGVFVNSYLRDIKSMIALLAVAFFAATCFC